MLTLDDIAAIPLFAGLVHADRERLAQAAADVHLRPANTRCTRVRSGRSSR
jgi:hypothetical protein